MIRFKQLSVLLLLATLTATSCLKDEFTEGEIGDGTIEISPEIKPDPICSRKTFKLNVDSSINELFLPFVDREYCECDTVDIELINVPNSVLVLGFISENDTNPNFKMSITDLTEPWFGQVVLLDTFVDLTILVRIDFDKCP